MTTTIYSADALVELEPYFDVHLNGERLPFEISRQIETLRIEEEENKRSTVEIQLYDADRTHLDVPLFDYQQSIVVYAGYRSAFEMRGPFEIVRIEKTDAGDGGITISVRGESGAKLSRQASRRVFSSGTVGDVFRAVAKANGLGFVADAVEGLSEALSSDFPAVQSGESDGAFLQRLASDFGWQFTVLQGRMHLTSAGSRAALGKVILDYNSALGSLSKVQAKYKEPRVSHVPIQEIQDDPAPLPIEDNPTHPQVALGEQFGSELDRLAAHYDRQRDAVKAKRDARLANARTAQEKAAIRADARAEYSRVVRDQNIDRAAIVEKQRKERARLNKVETYRAERERYMEVAKVAAAINNGGEDGSTRTVVTIDNEGNPVYTEVPDDIPRLSTSLEIPQPEIGESLMPDPIEGDEGGEPEKVARRKVIREGKLTSVEVSLKLGFIGFRPQHEIELTGPFGKDLGGSWRVAKAVHTYSSSGFDTDMTLKRPRPPKTDTQIPKGYAVGEDGKIRLERLPEQWQKETEPVNFRPFYDLGDSYWADDEVDEDDNPKRPKVRIDNEGKVVFE